MKSDWQIKKLGEVIDFQRGLTYSKKDEVSVSKNIVLRANNINLTTNELDLLDLKYINEKVIVPTNKKVKKGSLIICTASGSKSHLGKVALIDKDYDYAFGGFMGQITPHKIIDSKYLFYILASNEYKDYINKLSSGVNINNLRFDSLANYQISLPPLPEQQRIVKVLNEVFEKIDRTKKDAKENLQNAKDVFESYLQSVFMDKDDIKWTKRKLGEVCDTGAGGTPLKAHKDYYEGGNVPWLRSGEVDKKDILYSELFITEKGLKNSSAKLFPKNTVLIAMYGATAGQVGILRFESSTNQAICGILPNNNFLPEFIYYTFTAGKASLIKQAVGGAQPNISQIKIKNTFIPILSTTEQKTLVAKLDSLSVETKKLETIYKRKLINLEELKKSILNKAFNGEL